MLQMAPVPRLSSWLWFLSQFLRLRSGSLPSAGCSAKSRGTRQEASFSHAHVSRALSGVLCLVKQDLITTFVVSTTIDPRRRTIRAFESVD